MMSMNQVKPEKLDEKAALKYVAKAMANGKELKSELLYDGASYAALRPPIYVIGLPVLVVCSRRGDQSLITEI